ncbi:MAG: glycosyltransferase family 1 protein [Candidatus Edwardsbacteria bacterium]|nr:glycosyltransferase family 1 protein [Candidatus Edwardsbacteria bacterium]
MQGDPRIHLFLFHDGPRAGLPYQIADAVEFVTKENTRALYWEQVWLPLMLRDRRVPLYHATNNTGLPWCYPGRKVVTIHDVIPLLFPDAVPNQLRRFRLTNTLRIDARIADAVITVSEASRNDIVEHTGIRREKIDVIWSTNLAAAAPGEDRLSNDDREMLAIPSGYFLHNGGIDPRKNIGRLLRAYRTFAGQARVKDHRLVITGRSTTPFAREMAEYASELGVDRSVVFTGEILSGLVQRLVNSAEIVLYPSLLEGFGLPILEAMKAGVPVITSNLSSMREIAGGAAYLVDPYSESEIAGAMVDLHRHPNKRQALVRSGKRWVQLNSARDMMRSTTEIYFRGIA